MVESKRRLKLNKFGSFLQSVALTQAVCQIGKGLGHNYITMLRYYRPIPSSGSLAIVSDPTRNTELARNQLDLL